MKANKQHSPDSITDGSGLYIENNSFNPSSFIHLLNGDTYKPYRYRSNVVEEFEYEEYLSYGYSPQRNFHLSDSACILIAELLLAIGIWGIFALSAFGVLYLNSLAATMLMLAGIGGVYLGSCAKSALYSIVLGNILLTIGALRILPFTSHYVIDVLGINVLLAYTFIVAGFISVVAGFAKPSVFDEPFINKIP